MQRTEQHIISDQGELLLRSSMPKDWIVRAVLSDYGVDFEIEIVDNGRVTGHRFWVQLKTSKQVACKKRSFNLEHFEELGNIDVEYVSVRLKRKHAEYFYRTAIPVLLFVADLSRATIYWLPIRNFYRFQLTHDLVDASELFTRTIDIPCWQTIHGDASVDFYGLRWFAYEPGRLIELLRLVQLWDDIRYEVDNLRTHLNPSAMKVCVEALEEALRSDLLFGEEGVDFFVDARVTQPFGLPRLKQIFEKGVASGKKLLGRSTSTTADFAEAEPWAGMDEFLLRSSVVHAVDMLLTTAALYEGFDSKFLLTEANVALRHYMEQTGENIPLSFPARQRPRRT